MACFTIQIACSYRWNKTKSCRASVVMKTQPKRNRYILILSQYDTWFSLFADPDHVIEIKYYMYDSKFIILLIDSGCFIFSHCGALMICANKKKTTLVFNCIFRGTVDRVLQTCNVKRVTPQYVKNASNRIKNI